MHFLMFVRVLLFQSTTMLLPANVGDASGMVAQALALYKNLVVDTPAKRTLHETSVPTGSAKIEDEDGSILGAEERPHFSLQSPRKEE